MRDQRVLFHTYNAALVEIINRTTSQDPTVMIFVRRLLLASLIFNILFRAKHISGVYNVRKYFLSLVEKESNQTTEESDLNDFEKEKENEENVADNIVKEENVNTSNDSIDHVTGTFSFVMNKKI